MNFATALYSRDMPSCARPVYAPCCHLTQWLTGRPPWWVACVRTWVTVAPIRTNVRSRVTDDVRPAVANGISCSSGRAPSDVLTCVVVLISFDFESPIPHHLSSRWPSLLATLSLQTSFSSTSRRILVRKHSGQTMKGKIIIFCAFSAIQGGS